MKSPNRCSSLPRGASREIGRVDNRCARQFLEGWVPGLALSPVRRKS
jgi:hypothetical protein